jgi:hypothetical protein
MVLGMSGINGLNSAARGWCYGRKKSQMKGPPVRTYTGRPAPDPLILLSRMDILEAMVMTIVTLVVIGVILPAVWSAKPGRRAAARAVLELLLHLARRNSP